MTTVDAATRAMLFTCALLPDESRFKPETSVVNRVADRGLDGVRVARYASVVNWTRLCRLEDQGQFEGGYRATRVPDRAALRRGQCRLRWSPCATCGAWPLSGVEDRGHAIGPPRREHGPTQPRSPPAERRGAFCRICRRPNDRRRRDRRPALCNTQQFHRPTLVSRRRPLPCARIACPGSGGCGGRAAPAGRGPRLLGRLSAARRSDQDVRGGFEPSVGGAARPVCAQP